MSGKADESPPFTDRREAIQGPDDAMPEALSPGVVLRPLIGAHNGAQGLFTGLITLEGGSGIPYFTRPCTVAVTVLEGEVTLEVEGRQYHLGPLDCITIPGGVPRKPINPANRRAVLHVAMATGVPTLGTVSETFTGTAEPHSSSGREGCEHVTRGTPEGRFALAPHAMFQDYFNAELGSKGICGGYGLFDPGARLPCHRHDFDESISIVQGRATCIVEGRRYELSDNATALVPRGRCHYFINQSDQPMAMIWVYAGDMPDRIVMDESYCHPSTK